jgi:hypothetical protein
MHKTFGDLIRDLIKVYVDDLVLVFDRLRSTRTKLNLDKCVFRVTTGKLLGFLVSHWRIKDVHKLTRCLAALSRFISRPAEQALPFFKLL